MSNKINNEQIYNCLISWKENKDKDSFDNLVMYFNTLIHSIAKKIVSDESIIEDAESIGNIALIEAINNFDYMNKDVKKFIPYITKKIKYIMLKELRNYYKNNKMLSFEQPVGHNEYGDVIFLKDNIEITDDEMFNNIIKKIKSDAIKEILQCLSLEEAQIIMLRNGFIENNIKTYNELSKMYNCTTDNIRSVEAKALRKLRHPKNTMKLKEYLYDD